MTLEEAIKVKESLEELSADAEKFSWGPGLNFAKQRKAEALEIIKREIKELNDETGSRYTCERPECIKAQRDELRAKAEANTAEIRRLYQLCMDQQGEIYALKMARSMEQKTAALREAPNTKTAE